jgi:cytochrome c oxidase cbb3-type subunit 3
MNANHGRFAAILAGLMLMAAVHAAGPALQGPGGQAPPNPATQGGRGRGLTTFPAKQRPPDDPALVERGRQLYGITCRACHGPDLRGGDIGGPNLLRSDVMLNDKRGELLFPVVRGSRAPAMEAIDMTEEDVAAVAVYIHSVLAMAQAQGAPPPGAARVLNILVGDAAAGRAYFEANCTACHSAAGDLAGIGARVSTPMQLQNLWVGGGRGGGRGRGSDDNDPDDRRTPTVTVIPQSGQKVAGRLDRIDDFYVSLVLSDGTRQSFRRVGDQPKVEITDPLATHRALLEKYTDRDMHNVTAYLVTLK